MFELNDRGGVVPMLQAGPPPVSPVLSVCEVRLHKEKHLGKGVVVDALLQDASPHGVYLIDAREPNRSRCSLDLGSMGSGRDEDLWTFVEPLKAARVVVRGTLKTEVRDGMYGRRYRSYFIDRMEISRVPPAR
jgi:hypothetical protein